MSHHAYCLNIVTLFELIYKPMSGLGVHLFLMFVMTQRSFVTQISIINKNYYNIIYYSIACSSDCQRPEKVMVIILTFRSKSPSVSAMLENFVLRDKINISVHDPHLSGLDSSTATTPTQQQQQ